MLFHPGMSLINFLIFTLDFSSPVRNPEYRAQPESILLQAFETLDIDKKGYLLPEEISSFFKDEGEPFLQEELEEFLSASVDPNKGRIFYKGNETKFYFVLLQ